MNQENKNYDDVVETARNYYNSPDADHFYYAIWGGEDIHIGTYTEEEDTIFDASRRSVERLAALSEKLTKDARVLDIGAGYGGAARYLARTYGCHVVALNLSEKENERNRQMNAEQGLEHLIDVVDGSFEDLPFADQSFDMVWSQEAILHSGDREKVVREVSRVLKPGGEFLFSDAMKKEGCSNEALQPILDRIQLSTLGSPEFYRAACEKAGLQQQLFKDQTPHLPVHYGRVLQELEKNEDQLRGEVSEEYIANMKKGLQHWVNGGTQGNLVWGLFRFTK